MRIIDFANMPLLTSLPAHQGRGQGLNLLIAQVIRTAVFITALMIISFSSLVGAAADGTTPSLADTMRFQRLLHGKIDTDAVINAIQVTKQDPQGFMWFGGEHGLARYDGHNIKIYQHDPSDPSSLTSNAIWDIVFDHDDVMWLATDSGLGRYNPDTDTFTSFRSRGFNANTISGDSVRVLAVDKHNNLLIGTDNGFNILDPTRRNYRKFTADKDDPFRLPHQSVRAVYPEDNDTVWLGTSRGGLIRLHLKPFQTELFSHDENDPTSIAHNSVTDVIRDHTGALWISTFGGGISRMNPDGKTFTNYQNNPTDPNSLGSNTVWSLFEDSQHNLWIATDHGGMALYNAEQDNFSHLTHNPYDPSSLSSNNIRHVFEDRDGDLWIGAYPMGTNFFDRSSLAFDNHTHVPGDDDTLSHSAILSIEPSQKGHLWIGTEGGLNAFDLKTKKSQHYLAEPGKPGGLQFNAVLSLAEQSNGDLWVGTWSGGLHRLDPETGYFEHFPVQEGSVQGKYIWSLMIDKKHEYLWIGTETTGLNRYHFATQRFDHFPAQDDADANHLSNAHVWTIIETHDGDIWLGTMHGLNRFNPKTKTFKHYFNNPQDTNSLSNNRIVALFEDSQNRIWVGTQGGGISVIDASRQKFERVSIDKGLPSANVASIIEDNDGYIWATTDNGAVRFHPNEFSQLKKYQKSHGLVGNTFNRHNTYIDNSGRLYLGAAEGLSIFGTGQSTPTSAPPRIQFTDFRIFNESVNSTTEGSPLDNAIYNTKAITLDYDQRVISISYSALSYRSSNRNQYAYKLEGFDKDWINVGNRNSATYTNISPGSYTFKVKAANSQGIWNEKGIALDIKVLPPLWKTWWAYLLYSLCLVIIGYAVFRHKEKKIELEKERSVNAQLIQLDKMKDSFLANTSHELRTPLNGIIGLAESLRDECSDLLENNKIKQLDMIVMSGKRLSHLINDILDLSKLADRKIELKKDPVDLRYLTETVMALLAPIVDTKPIRLINDIPDYLFAVSADENRLQQIMFNLIGNAIKYSDRGYVRVSARQTEISTTISVKDTGIGIAQEDLKTIFQSFCQLEHSDAREHGGTGLGLAITKQLIELHGGTIDVISHPGKGTTFIFTMATSPIKLEKNKAAHTNGFISEQSTTPHPISIQKCDSNSSSHEGSTQEQLQKTETQPLNTELPKPEQPKAKSDALKEGLPQLKPAAQKLKVTPLENSHDLTILSVDDDPVNRIVLSGILKLHNYKILEAENGAKAIEMVEQHPEIDLVILDVMMPKMTGYEACEVLRKQHPMHELPVIFLTAKDVESELTQGFLSGGNDFVSKPVKKEELLARIKAQLSLSLHSRALQKTIQSDLSEISRQVTDTLSVSDNAFSINDNVSLPNTNSH